MKPASLHVRRPGGDVGYFLADHVEREGGTWTATGQWRYPSGRYEHPGTYTWPVRLVLQVRWGARRAESE